MGFGFSSSQVEKISDNLSRIADSLERLEQKLDASQNVDPAAVFQKAMDGIRKGNPLFEKAFDTLTEQLQGAGKKEIDSGS